MKFLSNIDMTPDLKPHTEALPVHAMVCLTNRLHFPVVCSVIDTQYDVMMWEEQPNLKWQLKNKYPPLARNVTNGIPVK